MAYVTDYTALLTGSYWSGIEVTASRLAAIAQSVEHIIRNDGVGGSNPSCGTST
jgi:hypothetical protein